MMTKLNLFSVPIIKIGDSQIGGSERSINSIVSIINDFRKISGLVINFEKSVLFTVGALTSSHPPHITNCLFQISHGSLHSEDFFHLNHLPKLSRLQNILNVWSGRDLHL